MSPELDIERMFREMGLATEDDRKKFSKLEDIVNLKCINKDADYCRDSTERIDFKVVSNTQTLGEKRYAELA